MPGSVRLEFRCKQKDADLLGSGAIRYCDLCSTQVHDLRDLPRRDVNALIEEKGGELCAMIYTDQLGKEKTEGRGKKIVTALLALILTGAVEPLTAQSDSIKTVQVDTSSERPAQTQAVDSRPQNVSVAQTDTNAVQRTYYHPDRQFLRMGSLHFFVSHYFPFIYVRRYHAGKIKKIRY